MTSTEQQRQRVTVISPFGQHQVDLPVDVPASGLLPDLLAVAGLHPSQVQVGSEGWRLEDAEGNPVPPAQTLAGHGVAPGEVIQLCGVHDRSPGAGIVSRQVPRAPAPSAPPEDALSPLQRTQAVLPARTGVARRVLATAGAYLQGPDSPLRADADPARLAALEYGAGSHGQSA
jgi:WXG100 protein secretion system (Wss), protein YukD